MENEDSPLYASNSHLEVFLLALNHARKDIKSLFVGSILEILAEEGTSLGSLHCLQSLKIDLTSPYMDLADGLPGKQDFALCKWFKSAVNLKHLTIVQGQYRTKGPTRLQSVDLFEIFKVSALPILSSVTVHQDRLS